VTISPNASINPQPQSFPVKLTLLVVSTLTVMAGATIAPSLPAMQQHFTEVDNVGYWVRLVLTVPALSIAISAPFVGVVIDQLGRKPLLTLALILYGLAGSSGVWLNALGMILLGRAFLGFSVASIMITATALIADYYTEPARGEFLGLQAAFMALGGVVFLSLGGFLADINWRMPFFIYLFALVLVPCVVLLLPEPKRAAGPEVTSQATLDQPLRLPFGLVGLTYGIALLTQIVFYLIPVQLPFYLKEIADATASQSGLAIALSTLFAAASSLVYSRIKSHLSFVAIYGIAFLNIGVGYVVISLANGYGLVLPGLAIAGFGLGLLMPNMNLCLTLIAPDSVRGRVLGGITTSFFLGQFLSPLVSQPLSQLIGLKVTYGVAGGVMLLLAAITAVVTNRWR